MRGHREFATLDKAGHPLHCTERLESESLGRGSPRSLLPQNSVTLDPRCRSPLPQQEAVTVGEASFKTGGGSAGRQEEQGLWLPALVFRRQYRQRQWFREGSCGLRVWLAVQPDRSAHSRQTSQTSSFGPLRGEGVESSYIKTWRTFLLFFFFFVYLLRVRTLVGVG